MSSTKFVLLNIFIILFIFAIPVMAQYSVDTIYYGISGNIDEVESLKLKIEHNLDTINTLGLAFIHDGKGINLEGSWEINFLKRSYYDINLNFLIPVVLDKMKTGKGIGFSGEGIYLNQNRYYWNVNYFLDRDVNQWVYEGGITLPMTVNTYLTLGIGNTYWDTDRSFKIGIKVDMD